MFLNADEIAREDNPADVEAVAIEAGRKALERRRALLESGTSLCVETTLAGNSIQRLMQQAKDTKYVVRLIFLFTPSPELNEMRVMQRVMEGGHNIPVDVIRRRHTRGLERLADCWALCDEGLVLDARTPDPLSILIKKDGKTTIVSQDSFAHLRRVLQAAGHRIPA